MLLQRPTWKEQQDQRQSQMASLVVHQLTTLPRRHLRVLQRLLLSEKDVNLLHLDVASMLNCWVVTPLAAAIIFWPQA
jgi:hypothetical protein